MVSFLIRICLCFSLFGYVTLTGSAQQNHGSDLLTAVPSKTSYTPGEYDCSVLTISQSEIEDIFESSVIDYSKSWYYQLDVPRCEFRGTVNFHGMTFPFIYYPNGFGSLIGEAQFGGTIRFICKTCDHFKGVELFEANIPEIESSE